MSRRYSLSEIADLLDRADGYDPAGQSITLRQVRNFEARGLLGRGQEVDGRGSKEFPARAVYAARIFQVATNSLGLDASALTVLADAMDVTTRSHPDVPTPASLRVPGAQVRGRALDDAIKGVAQGEAWFALFQRSVNRQTGVRNWRAEITYWTQGVEPEIQQLLELLTGESTDPFGIWLDLRAVFNGLPSVSELEGA